MAIKRDKFSSIIRILELDIFNDCHLATGQHDDVTHEHALCVSVVSSSVIAFNFEIVSRSVYLLCSHSSARVETPSYHRIFSLISVQCARNAVETNLVCSNVYDNRFYGQRLFSLFSFSFCDRQ